MESCLCTSSTSGDTHAGWPGKGSAHTAECRGVSVQEKDDCTHWCHPSGYQLWISQFYKVLQEQVHALPPLPSGAATSTSL